MLRFVPRFEAALTTGRGNGTILAAYEAWKALGAVLWMGPKGLWNHINMDYEDARILLTLLGSRYNALRTAPLNGSAVYREET